MYRIGMGKTAWVDIFGAASGALVCTAANAYLTGGLGPFSRMIGLNDTSTGLILSVGAVAAILIAPICGYASERWGRRRVMLLAMPPLIAGPTIMAVVFANPTLLPAQLILPLLILARALQAGGGTGMIPLAQAYAADATEADQRARGMGLVGAMLSAGTVAGSVLLWLAARQGAEIGFAALAVAGMASLIAIVAGVPETSPRLVSVRPQSTLACLRRTWPFLAITFLGLTAYLMVVPLIGLRLIDALGLPPGDAAATAGIVMTVASIAAALSQAQVALFSARRFLMILTLGCVVTGVAVGCVAVAGSVLAIALAMGIAGIALGQVSSVNHAALSLAAPIASQGRVSGLNALIRGVAMVVGPMLAIALYHANHRAPLVLAMLLLFVAAVLPMRGGQRGP
jgi:MFS family permease